ncbi:carbamoyl transferase [Candidatus Sulfurimonas marisnigri]|uniref:Carbamoyl transferase n=1 Tax=Candidatus Sulfurimonas marisnigri TaxID=2740405 RepID=A0A7S7LZ26_9BACT|nr:carbamoyltransferase C-terminal domain-containing protein [Candidatus Sulfurimonas marisnigri]QOY54077.1 carbamoyl transferase [Candidatus Sulfurimonas marisnigri]
MTIIGIYDGHNSSASLSIDGEIVCAVQEERFTKRKNETGFPSKAITYIMEKYHLDNSKIDVVAMATTDRTDINNIQYPIDAVFGIDDYIDMMNDYWKPKLSGQEYSKDYAKQIFEAKFSNEKNFYEIPLDFYNLHHDELLVKVQEVVVTSVANFMNLDKAKIKFYDHHTCHAMYGYFANPNKKDKTIAITVDAYGDGRNQTVWKIENDKFELITDSSQCEIGRLYRMVTLYLRMKPLEHEFKVMGLAPYAKDKYSDEVVKVFEELLEFDGLKIVHKTRPANLYEFLNEKLKYFRFDNIAGGIQKYTENMLLELFSKAQKEIGFSNFVFSGGVAMNVKANKAIGDLECVSDLFVAGSSSDESESIGACYFANYEHDVKNKPLNNLYLGTENSKEEVQAYIKENNLDKKYKISQVINTEIAELLAKGEVVARVSGKMEFGSRALGNRSILANPSNPSIIQHINELIKGRDFWMPFAATVLDTYAEKYLVNPKKFDSIYMAIAMDTKKEFLKDIKAGTHPYDETIRPQILTKKQNSDYYDLIEKFSEITGIGSLLNTSYNLHGLPVVNDVSDAIHVFENSGLKYLILDKILISKV